ncbi:MAG: hypothetical protein O2904_01290 [bacterium]|nr:hypothetical protein [bacterium]
MNKLFLFLLPLLFVACTQSDSIDAWHLKGSWVSMDDPKSAIQFTSTTKKDVYDGSVLSEGTFRISNNSHLMVESDETYTYTILKLTEKELEIMYLPHGNILRYEREARRL